MPGPTSFYVAPEQMMQDRAEYARKGIARGRSLAAITYVDGVLFVGVGKYNEFESLRVAGIRLADVRGYQYARDDVTAKSLATAYSQSLGAIFMGDSKPFEVELLIAQVDGPSSSVELFHILYDGSIVDETDVVAIGGDAEAIKTRLRRGFRPDMSLGEAVALGRQALAASSDKPLQATDLEVSGLDRTRGRRHFFRLDQQRVADLLDDGDAAPVQPVEGAVGDGEGASAPDGDD
jgi:proteasome alpha subunit